MFKRHDVLAQVLRALHFIDICFMYGKQTTKKKPKAAAKITVKCKVINATIKNKWKQIVLPAGHFTPLQNGKH